MNSRPLLLGEQKMMKQLLKSLFRANMEVFLPLEITASVSLCCGSSPGFTPFTCTVSRQTLIFPMASALSSGPAHSRHSLGIFLSSLQIPICSAATPKHLTPASGDIPGYLVGLDSKKHWL